VRERAHPDKRSANGGILLGQAERAAIAHLWQRKLDQDAKGLPQGERHRNLEPPSAEFLCALAAGVGAKRMLEIGGSSGISTIALASAAKETSGRLSSIEIEPNRQAESRETLKSLDLDRFVHHICDDAANVLPGFGEVDIALIDCEKEDYIRFFDMLKIAPGGLVIADNILSHSLSDYVAHVRSRPRVEYITLAIGKGLEITRFAT
jgi:predicted O-methyltransferase YrrM